jgi:ATP-dependent DNA helicase PIF1
VEGGLVNGSRGVVVGFDNGNPRVKFRHGKTRTIDRYTWEREDTHFTLLKSQLPLKLAWACSIHKSQGATLDYAEMDISGVFEYGQAYVAMSRVRSPESLIIKDYNVKKIKCHPKAIKFYRDLD